MVLLLLVALQPCHPLERRTPSWDGWDFAVAEVSVRASTIYVVVCNESPNGYDGDVVVTCVVDGQEYSTAVRCRNCAREQASIAIPQDTVDRLFTGADGFPGIPARSSPWQGPAASIEVVVPIGIKGGPLGWWLLFADEYRLTFTRE